MCETSEHDSQESQLRLALAQAQKRLVDYHQEIISHRVANPFQISPAFLRAERNRLDIPS